MFLPQYSMGNQTTTKTIVSEKKKPRTKRDGRETSRGGISHDVEVHLTGRVGVVFGYDISQRIKDKKKVRMY